MLNDQYERMYRNAEASMVMAVDKVRKSGQSLSRYVIVVAEMSHKGTWLFMRDLTGSEPPSGPNAPTGMVSLSLVENTARVLRLCKAEEQAKQVEQPLEDGDMRLLFTADGQVNVVDIPAFPPLPTTGEA